MYAGIKANVHYECSRQVGEYSSVIAILPDKQRQLRIAKPRSSVPRRAAPSPLLLQEVGHPLIYLLVGASLVHCVVSAKSQGLDP